MRQQGDPGGQPNQTRVPPLISPWRSLGAFDDPLRWRDER